MFFVIQRSDRIFNRTALFFIRNFSTEKNRHLTSRNLILSNILFQAGYVTAFKIVFTVMQFEVLTSRFVETNNSSLTEW